MIYFWIYYVVGVLSFVCICKKLNQEFTVGDLLLSVTMFWTVAPFALILYTSIDIIQSIHTRSVIKFFNTKLF